MVIILLIFPEYAIKCIEAITENGFEAYFVGGCVRDGILGRNCDDIDITTSATPEEIISLFPHTVPTGIKHGTVTIIIDKHPIEVTTFRQEFGYNDSRHPDEVVFVSNLEDDLSRRDFTINALACDKNGKIIDIFNGLLDLKAGIIKAVGEPKKRFEEDALRIVRAYRFASVLGFKIDENTRNAAITLSSKINSISGERLLGELKKAACGKQPAAICELISTGVFKEFGIISQPYSNETFNRLSCIDIAPTSMLAILLTLCRHDTELIKSKLKADNQLLTTIKSLDKLLMLDVPNNKKQIQKLLYKHNILYLRVYFYYLFVTNKVTNYYLFDMLDDVLKNCEPYRISHLAIDGNDLLEIGYTGAKIKELLEKALFAVIDEKISNTKEALLDFLKN